MNKYLPGNIVLFRPLNNSLLGKIDYRHPETDVPKYARCYYGRVVRICRFKHKTRKFKSSKYTSVNINENYDNSDDEKIELMTQSQSSLTFKSLDDQIDDINSNGGE